LNVIEDDAIDDDEKPTDAIKVELPPMKKDDSKEHMNIVFIGHVGTFAKPLPIRLYQHWPHIEV
jgi:hypothetical protein